MIKKDLVRFSYNHVRDPILLDVIRSACIAANRMGLCGLKIKQIQMKPCSNPYMQNPMDAIVAFIEDPEEKPNDRSCTDTSKPSAKIPNEPDQPDSGN